MSAQFDHALSEAAATMDSFGVAWDDSVAEEGDGDDLLPLEFQLADIERAVDSMLLERDRFLYGHEPVVPLAAAERGGAPSGKGG